MTTITIAISMKNSIGKPCGAVECMVRIFATPAVIIAVDPDEEVLCGAASTTWRTPCHVRPTLSLDGTETVMLITCCECGAKVPVSGVTVTVGVVLCGIVLREGSMTEKLIGDEPELSIE